MPLDGALARNYKRPGYVRQPSTYHGLGEVPAIICQAKWELIPSESTQHYQVNTPDCYTTNCHERRPEYLLSSEEA
jgi:hypothetical protein